MLATSPLARRAVSRFAVAAAVGFGLLLTPLPGAAQYFGGNKVQYRTFDFKVLRTEHFDV